MLFASLLVSQAHADTLGDVFNKVVTTNPTILASRHGINVAKESMAQAQGGFFPTITATGSTKKSNTSNDNGTDTNNYPKSVGVNLKQTLFAGGGVVSGYRASRNSYFSTKATHDSTVQATLNNLVSAYIGVLTAEEVLNLQINQVKLLQQQMKMTDARFTQGEVTRTDVMQATARLAAANAGRIQAAGNYRTSQTSLANLVGEPVSNITWPKIDLDLPKEYNAELNEATLNKHPNVIAALSALSSKKYNVKVAKAAHYPEINAVASYSNNNDTAAGDYDNSTIGVEMSIPLFQGGNILSAVRAANYSKEQALQNYEQIKRDTTTNLVDAIELYTTALASLQAFKDGEQAAKRADEGVEKEQMLGERTVLELLDSRQELLEARVNVAKGKGSVIIQAYNLLSAMGTLNVHSAD